MGTLSFRKILGHRSRGLQQRRERLGLLPPRLGPEQGIPVGGGWPRRLLRPLPDPLLRPRLLERARSYPEGAPVRARSRRGQPRRGREGVLLLSRFHTDPLLHEVALQVPAAGVSLLVARGGESDAGWAGTGVRAPRYWGLRRRSLLRRVRGVREGEPRGHRNPR